MITRSLEKVFYSNLEFFFGMLLVLVPDWDLVLSRSLHCAIDLRGPDRRGVRSCITDRWFIWLKLTLTLGKGGGGI